MFAIRIDYQTGATCQHLFTIPWRVAPPCIQKCGDHATQQNVIAVVCPDPSHDGRARTGLDGLLVRADQVIMVLWCVELLGINRLVTRHRAFHARTIFVDKDTLTHVTPCAYAIDAPAFDDSGRKLHVHKKRFF